MGRGRQPGHLDRIVRLPAPPRQEAAGAGERTMKRNRVYLLGGFLLLVFAGFSFSSFKDTLTPYVSYEEARRGGQVQVAGGLVKGSSSYETGRDALYFTIKD